MKRKVKIKESIMADYYDDPYLDDESYENFDVWYETGNKIRELSRQLRTFLKYKSDVIKHRFCSPFTLPVNRDHSTFLRQKQELHDTAFKFIHILKDIKKNAQSLEQEIQVLAMRFDSTSLKQLIESSNKVFLLIHSFSEQDLHDHPELLHFIVKLAREASVVKKCLDFPLNEFYAELELNYEGLDYELEDLVPEKYSREKLNRKEAIKERVRS